MVGDHFPLPRSGSGFTTCAKPRDGQCLTMWGSAKTIQAVAFAQVTKGTTSTRTHDAKNIMSRQVIKTTNASVAETGRLGETLIYTISNMHVARLWSGSTPTSEQPGVLGPGPPHGTKRHAVSMLPHTALTT